SVLDVMQRNFKTVRHVKPAASRSESVESYVLANGFHGEGRAQDIEADIAAGRRNLDGTLII
ncbi:MAG: 23S rRNA methyltransferase, partial [Candidatus Puniceispirillaceae bacterium]